MEQSQIESQHHSYNQHHSHTIATIVAGLALSACSGIPLSYSYSTNYETDSRYVPHAHNHPPLPTIINRKHTHNGPLGDKICTHTYSNREKVRLLCDPKPDKEIQKYTHTKPGETKFTPGKIEYGYSYGLQPNGKYGYGFGPQNIPPKYKYIMPNNIHCTKYQTYHQDTGAAAHIRTQCSE